MRYYSTQRPVGPGTFPKPDGNKVVAIKSFAIKCHVQKINREAWGYIDYEQPLPTEEAASYELVPETPIWYPVTVSSRKHGGGLHVFSGQPVMAEQCPSDEKGDTHEMQSKTRYFRTEQEAQEIMDTIQSLDITTERVRMSVTQGEVRVFINGKYILNFGDKIVLPERGARPEDYYGDDIGGWRSSEPDSGFVLGLIWHPHDRVYHYSEKICEILGITPDEWIEGKDYTRRDKK